MPQAVFILWTILLVVTVLLLPFIVYLLHKTWKASRSIERYFKEMLEAGLGVAGNTEHVKALDDTIAVASGMLAVAGDINQHAETIKVTLAGKAAKLN
jgi:DNA-binding phage protein